MGESSPEQKGFKLRRPAADTFKVEGSPMKNVIDMTARLKIQTRRTPATDVNSDAALKAPAPIIDMTEMRNEINAQERRRTKRTILSDFIGAFVLVPRKGLLKVNLYDISERGLAFDLADTAGHFSVGEEIAMRVYLNQQTYFPFVVKVQNVRAVEDEKTFRHGANFGKDALENQAVHHFVRFIESVSAQLQTDKGDLQVSGVVR